jgi:hypothetical protein
MDIIYCFFNAKTPMLVFTPMGVLVNREKDIGKRI